MSEQTPDPAIPSAAAAGWYPDPQAPGQQRYWDGNGWTAAAPLPPGAAAVGGPTTSTNAVVGLVLAIVSWVVCPIVAAIAALLVARASTKEIAASGGRVGGAGLNTATRIIAWINIGVSIVAGFVVILLVAFGVIFSANVASTLDPVTNAQTGLADGRYAMQPERWVSISDECTYGGPVISSDSTPAGDVTVYGTGLIECPNLTEVSVVLFEVRDGVARIVDVE
jgi:hypothetical protein